MQGISKRFNCGWILPIIWFRVQNQDTQFRLFHLNSIVNISLPENRMHLKQNGVSRHRKTCGSVNIFSEDSFRLATIIKNSFLYKNGNRRYKYMVLGREGPYFVKEHSDSKSKYTEEDIIKMLEFLVDNIFVVFAGKVFPEIIDILIGTNCASLLADRCRICCHWWRML